MSRSLADLKGKNIVVYDLEIKNVIDGRNIKWTDFDKMGISVGCSFDYRRWGFSLYMDDNMGDLVDRLNEPGTMVVAFNQISFDNNLLRVGGLNLKTDLELNNYDMLRESRQACKASPFSKGFKLDNHLEAMGLPMKTDHGSQAPLMYKAGQMGKLCSYVLNDVAVEKNLFEQIYLTGKMASFFNPRPYQVRMPEI